MKILMVCLGNICRSPMAEVIFRDLVKKRGLSWTVHSAGTNRYHKGGPADPRAVAECLRRGLDLQAHVARRVVPQDFDAYDVLYSMAEDVTEELAEFATRDRILSRVRPFVASGRDVPDPWYGSDGAFASCFELLEQAASEQLEKLIGRDGDV